MNSYKIWHPYTQHKYEKVQHVDSAYQSRLYLKNGRVLIDAISSWWVMLHGHRREEIVQAIQKQLSSLQQVIFSGFTHDAAIEAAQEISSIMPDPERKIFFSDNGSTAIEVALKIAIQSNSNEENKSLKIIALKGAYHGETFGSMSVSSRSTFNAPFNKQLFEVDFIDLEDSDIFNKFKALVDSPSVAAFIYEPLVQGAYGMRIYAQDLLESLLKIAKQHSVITIADEVFSGLGRSAHLLASNTISTTPDIICLSKGLTAGFLPLGVSAVSNNLYQRFLSDNRNKMFLHGHSFSGNALACSAAAASIRLLKEEKSLRDFIRIQESHQSAVKAFSSNDKISSARSIGTIFAIDLKLEAQVNYFDRVRDKIYDAALSRGVLLRPLANCIYCVPPLNITDHELAEVYHVMQHIVEII